MKKIPIDFIIEYADLIKDKYPHLSFADIERVCRNNFRMLKAEMKNGSLRTVRMRFFGTFVVFKGRAIGLVNRTRKMYKNNQTDIKNYNHIHTIVGEYLKREYNEDIPPEEVSES